MRIAKSSRRSLRAITAVGTALLALSCGSDHPSEAPATTDDGGTPSEGGTDGGGLVDCNSAPHDDQTVVSDQCGVFVAPTGSDGAAGTKSAPVKTLAQAVSLARTAHKNVFVCGDANTTYVEASAVGLTVDDQGRGLFGGFSCDAWAFDPTLRATFTVSQPGALVLRVDGTKQLRIQDLGFTSQDAVEPGTSSIIALVTGGADVELTRAHFAAGRGANGAAGAASPATLPPASAGNPPTGVAGGALKTCSCSDGSTSGGAGGTATSGLNAGAAGSPAGAAGDGGAPAVACSAGGDGNDGADGKDGRRGDHPNRHGELTATGWTTRVGAAGATGALAQGGGGGASGGSNGGSSGGCGGCGGTGGLPGQTGGSSIAIAIVDSDLEAVDTLFEMKRGGDGGDGAAGQVGQPGGAGGTPSAPGCSGGAGGAGGAGGGGGGGSGGHSVAVLYTGKVPTLDNNSSGSTRLGVAGRGGLRGNPANEDDRALPGVSAALWISD